MNRLDKDRLLGATQKTVNVFAEIMQRRVILLNGDFLVTDNEIHAKFADKFVYSYVEKALAHQLFGTSAHLLSTFTGEMVQRIMKAAAQRNMTLDAPSISNIVYGILDILESHRVESLWACIYSGSRLGFNDIKQRALEELTSDGLLPFLASVEAGTPMERSQYLHVKPLFEKALRAVEGTTLEGTLIIGKGLLTDIIDLLLREKKNREGVEIGDKSDEGISDKGKARIDAFSLAASMAGEMGEEASSYYQQIQCLDEKEVPELDWAAPSIDNIFKLTTPDQIESALDTISKEAKEHVQSVEDALSSQEMPVAGQFTGIDAIFQYIRVNPASVQKSWLAPEDETAIHTLKKHVRKIDGRARFNLSDVGTEVDPVEYIQGRISHRADPCFRTPTYKGKPKIMILLDRSRSMRGHRMDQAHRALTILSTVLRKNVSLEVWGFASTKDGVVKIWIYPSVTSFELHGDPADGITPLGHAVLASVERLAGDGPRHLLVVTDGYPRFRDHEGNLVADKVLSRMVRDAVLLGRRKGIRITTALLGDRDPKSNEIIFDAEDDEVKYMFGSKNTWRKLDADNFAQDLVSLVTTTTFKSFTH